MSFSRGSSRNSKLSNQPRPGAVPLLDAAASLYAQDSQTIQTAVKEIQNFASAIRREAGLLGGPNAAQVKERVSKAVREAKKSGEEAGRLLRGFDSHLAGQAVNERNQRRMMQQKLQENLTGALTQLETEWQAFEATEKRLKESVPVAAKGAKGAVSVAATDLEMQPVTPRPPQLQQQALEEVTDAEIETQTALNQEMAEEVSDIANSIVDLQRMMYDLHATANAAQGSIDNIESNVSNATESSRDANEQLTQASRGQQTGNGRLFWVLLVLALVCLIIVIGIAIAARK